MAQMYSTRSSGASSDARAAGALIEGAPVLIHARRSTGPAWAPPGYDEADLRVLEWIASHRRGRLLRLSA